MQIELYKKLNENPMAAVDWMGQYIASSGMFGCSKAEQGKVIAFTCFCEAITPVQFNRRYHVMDDGKLSMKALHILSEFRKLGGKHKWLKDGEDGKSARLRLEFEGEVVEYESNIDKAKARWKGREDKFARTAWATATGNMLRADCARNGVAMLCPEIVAGFDDTDESDQPTSTAPLLPPKPVEAKVDAPNETAPVRRAKANRDTKPVDAEIVSSTPEKKDETVNKPAAAESPAVTNLTSQATTAAEPPPIGYKVTLGEDGRISPDSAKALLAMCKARGPEFDSKALKWLDDKRYTIRPDGKSDVFAIKPERLQRIFDNREDWFKTVEAVQ